MDTNSSINNANGINHFSAVILADALSKSDTLTRIYLCVPRFTGFINDVMREFDVSSVDAFIGKLLAIIAGISCKDMYLNEMIDRYGSDELKEKCGEDYLTNEYINEYINEHCLMTDKSIDEIFMEMMQQSDIDIDSDMICKNDETKNPQEDDDGYQHRDIMRNNN